MNTQIKRIPNANTISSVSEKFRIFQYVMDYKSVYLSSNTKRNRGEEFEPGGFADCF